MSDLLALQEEKFSRIGSFLKDNNRNSVVNHTFNKEQNNIKCIYALVVDEIVMYIGKTKNLRGRMDTYRSHSQTGRSKRNYSSIKQSLEQGKSVKVYIKKFPEEYSFEGEQVNSMIFHEYKSICKFNPLWNFQVFNIE